MLKERRDTAVDIISTIPGMTVSRPDATFYLFPDVTDSMQHMGFDDVAQFATAALHETGVSFCTRRHFGRPQPGEQRNYIRFAYSGISTADISEGLGLLGEWIEAGA